MVQLTIEKTFIFSDTGRVNQYDKANDILKFDTYEAAKKEKNKRERWNKDTLDNIKDKNDDRSVFVFYSNLNIEII